MKTHVIQLNHFDDTISIKDKISWSKASRILVVWPDSGKIFLTRIDLMLILRQVDALGAQLAFVSDDKKLKEFCKEIGIQVFDSIPSAYKSIWRRSKRVKRRGFESESPKKIDLHAYLPPNPVGKQFWNSRFIRIPMFILALFAIGCLLAFFIPSAEIGLTPVSDLKSIDLAVWANQDISTVNFSGALPARKVYIEVEDSYTGLSSGYVRIPGQNAAGELTFRNLTNGQVQIPAGTIVRTTGEALIRFKTDELLTLPEGINSVGHVSATSLEGGVSGNVSPFSIIAIEGLIGGSVTVENSSPFSGGTDIKTLAPSENDYLKASQALKTSLDNKALVIFSNEFPGIYMFVDETLTNESIILEERFPAADTPGERFTLRMKYTYSIWTITNSDLLELVKLTSTSILKEGESIDPDSITIETTSSPRFDQDFTLRWEISAKMVVKPAINASSLAKRLVGLSVAKAEDLIQKDSSLKLTDDITVYPSFWKQLPYLPIRIKVTING